MSNNEPNMRAKREKYNFVGTALREMAAQTVSGDAGAWYELTAGLTHRNSLIIANSGVGTVYIGPENATEVNAIPLATGDKIAIDASEEIQFYVFSSGAFVSVSVMELD